MLGNRWGVGVGWGGGVPFLSIIIRLLSLACRCLHGLSISGAALDDAEHSLADLDFRDQLTRDSRRYSASQRVLRRPLRTHEDARARGPESSSDPIR